MEHLEKSFAVLMQPGDAAFEAGNFTEALIYYKPAYKQALPAEAPKALLKLCDCLIKLGRFEDAISYAHESKGAMSCEGDNVLLIHAAQLRIVFQPGDVILDNNGLPIHAEKHTIDDLALLLRVAECRLGLRV